MSWGEYEEHSSRTARETRATYIQNSLGVGQVGGLHGLHEQLKFLLDLYLMLRLANYSDPSVLAVICKLGGLLRKACQSHYCMIVLSGWGDLQGRAPSAQSRLSPRRLGGA